MVRVRRRYATQIVFPPLFPALKGRAIFRGRYAAKNYAALGGTPAFPEASFALLHDSLHQRDILS
jgi:hypothetical protein